MSATTTPGNSNWRRPIWFPVNYWLVESLREYEHHAGETLTVEGLRGSGQGLTIGPAADERSQRLTNSFLRDQRQGGRGPVYGGEPIWQENPEGQAHIRLYEYYHGDSGAGVGASHQPGWTALVANWIQARSSRRNHV